MVLIKFNSDNEDLTCMWFYRLEALSGQNFYYDKNELAEAREDKANYGGTLTDRKGTIY